jgi:hypothetical protein
MSTQVLSSPPSLPESNLTRKASPSSKVTMAVIDEVTVPYLIPFFERLSYE